MLTCTMTSKRSHEADQPKARRGPRRVTVAGTGPDRADEPEPRLDDLKPDTKPSQPKLSARDRSILEDKPPHY